MVQTVERIGHPAPEPPNDGALVITLHWTRFGAVGHAEYLNTMERKRQESPYAGRSRVLLARYSVRPREEVPWWAFR